MGHALEKAHHLLSNDARLIDIRPTDGPRPIEVRIGGQTFLAGWLQEENDYIEYAQAEEAVTDAINEGWYAVEQLQPFTHTYHAETIQALHDHLAETSRRSIIDDGVIMRANDLMKTTIPDSEVVLSVPVSTARLRPLPRYEA